MAEVSSAVAKPNVSPEKLIELICKLVQTKPAWRGEIVRRVSADQSLTVKGIEVTPAILKEVLAPSV